MCQKNEGEEERKKEEEENGLVKKTSISFPSLSLSLSRFLPFFLLPPGLQARAEVRLGPRAEEHHVVGDLRVRERERQRRRAAHLLARRVVLRAVARAHELVLGLVPRHDAPEVRADGVEAVLLDLAAVGHDEVGRVALEALRELARAGLVRLEPGRGLDVVAGRVLGGLAAAAAADPVLLSWEGEIERE